MRTKIVIAAVFGYSIGNLPDDGLAWTLVKLCFTVAALVILLVAIRRERS
jgi:hypothetical protein